MKLKRLWCLLFGHSWVRTSKLEERKLLLHCPCGATTHGVQLPFPPVRRYEGDAERHRLKAK